MLGCKRYYFYFKSWETGVPRVTSEWPEAILFVRMFLAERGKNLFQTGLNNKKQYHFTRQHQVEGQGRLSDGWI